MSESEDLYEILQVHPTAEPEVIQAAYRQLARIYNPALCHAPENKSLAETRTGQLNRAYAVLKDPVLRAAYDRTRAASGSPAGSSPPRGTDGQQPDGMYEKFIVPAIFISVFGVGAFLTTPFATLAGRIVHWALIALLVLSIMTTYRRLRRGSKRCQPSNTLCGVLGGKSYSDAPRLAWGQQ